MNDPNDLWAEAYELGILISKSPEVEEYKKAQEQMEANSEIKPLLNKLRDVQSDYERLKSYGDGPHLKGLEDSITEMIAKLDQFPEVVAFKQACNKVDNLLGSVTMLLGQCISGEVNGEPLQNSEEAPKGG